MARRGTPSLAWLNPSWKANDIRALIWHYTKQARNDVNKQHRVIDPRLFSNLKQLREFVTTNLADVAEPSDADFIAMEAAYLAITDKAVLDVLNAGVRTRRASQPPQGNGDHGPPSPSSPPSPLPRGDAPDIPDQRSEDRTSTSRREKRGRTIQSSTGEDQKGEKDPTSRRRRKLDSDSEVEEVHQGGRTSPLFVTCPSRWDNDIQCDAVCELQEVPRFCGRCGTAWAAAFASHKSSASSTSSSSAPPRVWKGAATYSHPSLASITPRLQPRAVELANLPDSIIKKAREGQTHLTLHDCLHPLAVHGGAVTSSFDHDRIISLRLSESGQLTAAPDAAGRAAQTSAQRRRLVASFADIAEAFFFTLIPLIYHDRPDIGVQLYKLLLRGSDLHRSTGDWTLAFRYIEAVRLNFFQSTQSTPPVHVVDIDATVFDMGALHQDVLDAARAARTSDIPSTGAKGARRQPDRGLICNDFNSESCVRTDCRYRHVCSRCQGDHSAKRCPQPQDAPRGNSGNRRGKGPSSRGAPTTNATGTNSTTRTAPAAP